MEGERMIVDSGRSAESERKTAFVTGGSRGIGRGIVKAFAEAGYEVAFTYNSKLDEAQRLQAEIAAAGGRAHFRQASLETDGVAEETVAWAIGALGHLDAAVCNAGLTVHNNLLKLTEEVVDFAYNLDCRSYLLCIREAARHMRERGIRGRIVLITSSRGQRAYPEDPLYGGMKAALHRACESLALEFCGDGITINCVAPGNTAIRGSFTQEELTSHPFQRKIPLGRSGTPREVGALVRYLASEDAGYLTGTVIRIDGGLILPAMPQDVSAGAGPGWHEIPANIR